MIESNLWFCERRMIKVFFLSSVSSIKRIQCNSCCIVRMNNSTSGTGKVSNSFLFLVSLNHPFLFFWFVNQLKIIFFYRIICKLEIWFRKHMNTFMTEPLPGLQSEKFIIPDTFPCKWYKLVISIQMSWSDFRNWWREFNYLNRMVWKSNFLYQ